MPLRKDSCFQVKYLQRFIQGGANRTERHMETDLPKYCLQKKSINCGTPAEVREEHGDSAGTVRAEKHLPWSGGSGRILSSSLWTNIPSLVIL